MKKRGSITVFAALSFSLIASVLFSLLELARVYELDAYAGMTSSLAIESVCAEYQPKLWENYHLLGLDGAYGGTEFSIDHVTGVLSARIATNLTLSGDGSRIMGLEHEKSTPKAYQLLTDGEGDVFLHQVSEYMRENLPAEMIQILYDRYQENKSVEDSQQVESSVEDAQTAIEEAKSQMENAEGTGSDTGTSEASGAGSGTDTSGAAGAGSEAAPAEVEENPLELVLSLKQNALLGMVTDDVSSLSTAQIDISDSIEKRTCQKGTLSKKPTVNLYDKVLVLEYMNQYFSNYLSPSDGHALSYEMEYVLCGKESDKDNLEAVVGRLLLMREAANVTYILSDSQKRAEAAALAGTLAGFTGNPAIIKVVEIGIVAAWAYIESILDIRALLAGDKIALMKNSSQWVTQLGSFSAAMADGAKAKNCENGLGYLDYLKGFLFTMQKQKLAYRMMNIMEKSIQMVPAYQNCKMDHVLCHIDYEMVYTAEPLFSRLSVVGKKGFSGLYFGCDRSFSYCE